MTTNTVTTTTTEISLAKLVPSPANVRRTGAGAGIEALAASIQAHGLLQSLVVRPKLDGDGQADRPLRGCRRRAQAGRAETAGQAEADHQGHRHSLPRAGRRTAWTGPRRAWPRTWCARTCTRPTSSRRSTRLHQGGIGIEDIAARFGVSAHTVRQRLRLASVSPALIQAYRDEELTLDHLTAFAVTEDQEAQERVFGQLQDWQRNPDTIRRLLTHALIPATDRKVLFVGLDAYTAAGGTVQRDLFSEDRGGWITDAGVAGAACRGADGARGRGDPGRGLALGCASGRKRRRRRGTCGGSGRTRWRCRPRTRRGAANWQPAMTSSPSSTTATATTCPTTWRPSWSGSRRELAALEAREEAWQPEDVAIARRDPDHRRGRQLAGRPGLRAAGGRAEARSRSRSSAGRTRLTDEPGPEDDAADEHGRQHRDAVPTRAGAGGQGPCPLRRLAGRIGGAPDGGLAGGHRRAARACLAGDAACPGDGRLLQPLRRDGRCPSTPIPLPSPPPAPASPTVRRGRPWTKPKAHGAAACPASMAPCGDGCRTRTCRRCSSLLAVCVARAANAGGRDWTTPEGGQCIAAQVASAAGLDMRTCWTRDQGQLSRPGAQGADRGGGARGCRARVRPSRSPGAKKEVMVADAEQLLAGTGWLPAVLRVPAPTYPVDSGDTDSLTIPPMPMAAE